MSLVVLGCWIALPYAVAGVAAWVERQRPQGNCDRTFGAAKVADN